MMKKNCIRQTRNRVTSVAVFAYTYSFVVCTGGGTHTKCTHYIYKSGVRPVVKLEKKNIYKREYDRCAQYNNKPERKKAHILILLAMYFVYGTHIYRMGSGCTYHITLDMLHIYIYSTCCIYTTQRNSGRGIQQYHIRHMNGITFYTHSHSILYFYTRYLELKWMLFRHIYYYIYRTLELVADGVVVICLYPGYAYSLCLASVTNIAIIYIYTYYFIFFWCMWASTRWQWEQNAQQPNRRECCHCKRI